MKPAMMTDASEAGTWHRLTSAVIIGAILILIGYDILTFREGGSDTTISLISFLFMKHHPALAFAGGALAGHLTWSNPRDNTNRTVELVVLLLGGVLLIAVDLLHVVPSMLPLWPFLAGIPAGHFLFGQNVAPLVSVWRRVR